MCWFKRRQRGEKHIKQAGEPALAIPPRKLPAGRCVLACLSAALEINSDQRPTSQFFGGFHVRPSKHIYLLIRIFSGLCGAVRCDAFVIVRRQNRDEDHSSFCYPIPPPRTLAVTPAPPTPLLSHLGAPLRTICFGDFVNVYEREFYPLFRPPSKLKKQACL